MTEVRLEIGSIYVLPKIEFNKLLTRLKDKEFITLGPRVENDTLIYAPIDGLNDLPRGYISEQEAGHYRLIKTGQERYFDHIPGAHSWKQFLFPPRTELFRLHKNGGWNIELPPAEQPK